MVKVPVPVGWPEAGVGTDVKDAICPFATKANKLVTIKIIFVSNFPCIRFDACNQIYGGLTDKKNKCCRTKGLPYFTLFF